MEIPAGSGGKVTTVEDRCQFGLKFNTFNLKVLDCELEVDDLPPLQVTYHH